MTWTNYLIILRNFIDDVATVQLYTDERLTQLLTVGAYILVGKLNLDNVVNISTNDISPVPDEDIMSLIILQAATLLAESEWKTAALRGYSVKDGVTSIDPKSMIDAKAAYAKALKSQLDKALLMYQAGNRGVGVAIVGPSRFTTNSYNQVPRFY